MQEYENKWHPVAYFSRKMSPAKQNYGIRNKELLAIVVLFKAYLGKLHNMIRNVKTQ